MAKGKKQYRKISTSRFHPKTEFRIEPPSGRRKGYRIRYKEPGNNWLTFSTKEIDVCNDLFLKGVTDVKATKESLKLILKQLYEQRDKYAPKVEMLSKNIRLVELVYETKYPRPKIRRMQRPENPKQEMLAAVKEVGIKFPLATCDLDELDDYLHEKLEDRPAKLYRTITWINVLLRHLGRRPLDQIDPETPDVRYITEEDLVTKLLPATTNAEDKLLYTIAFYTGLRIGEIFYITNRHVKPHTLWVEGQMLEDGRLVKRLKRGTQPHDALLPKDAVPAVEAWCDISMDDRRKIRQRKHAERIRALCKKLWKNDETKHLKFHDLRHSNTIWILENTDYRLSEVAQHLGNSVAVVERYYSGFVLKKGSIDRGAKMLDERVKNW